MKSIVRAGCFFFLLYAGSAHAAAYPYQVVAGTGFDSPLMPVIGFLDKHEVQRGETLLDIARNHGLGFNEIADSHPEIDPWLPGKDDIITIPTSWILPATRYEGVVINIPEMRLYRFFKEQQIVKTYPVGIGRDGFHTPVMECRITERQENPTWFVPPYARKDYPVPIVPPGDENPLGDYWIGFSADYLGIHGTNFPWGIGRKVSHGCLRMYPEHIEQFFDEVDRGTRVEIIYEPVKVGIRGDRIYMEAHPDHYGRIDDYSAHVWRHFKRLGLDREVNQDKVRQCLEVKNGIPTQVGRITLN